MDQVMAVEDLLGIQTPLRTLWQLWSVFFNKKQEPSKFHWYENFSLFSYLHL